MEKKKKRGCFCFFILMVLSAILVYAGFFNPGFIYPVMSPSLPAYFDEGSVTRASVSGNTKIGNLEGNGYLLVVGDRAFENGSNVTLKVLSKEERSEAVHTIHKTAGKPAFEIVGSVVELTADKYDRKFFPKSVVLQMKIPPRVIDETELGYYTAAYFNEELDKWIYYHPDFVDSETGVMQVTLEHFSWGGFFKKSPEEAKKDFLDEYCTMQARLEYDDKKAAEALVPWISVNVGSTKAGLNMNAVRDMGQIIKKAAELTSDRDGLGCAKLVVFANAVEDNPFMAGAFCGPGEPETAINVGVSGPGVVKRALEQCKGQPFDIMAETIKRTAFKITRVGQLVAREASSRLNIPAGIVDLSLAPTPSRGDSVAHILTEMGLEYAGAPGTTAALAMLNDAVKKGGIMASNHVGGLSGAFIPVSEDIGMIEAATAGALTLEKLEAMTCVCSVGLDMIAIPGDVSPATISGIIADEAAIGMVNNKTTAVRVIPAIGKKAGDVVHFGGLLGYAPVMPVNRYDCSAFIERGGRIPAPLHSLRN